MDVLRGPASPILPGGVRGTARFNLIEGNRLPIRYGLHSARTL
jgi:hypothetical protein